MTREIFQQRLQELNDSVLVMGSMVDQAIERSVRALRDQDTRLAGGVISDDVKINHLRFDIEDSCLLLIATQAPMASDLRMLAAALHISTDLERMADHAAGIAKITLLTANEPLLKPLVDIPHMADIAREMLRDSLRAFVERDTAAARTDGHTEGPRRFREQRRLFAGRETGAHLQRRLDSAPLGRPDAGARPQPRRRTYGPGQRGDLFARRLFRVHRRVGVSRRATQRPSAPSELAFATGFFARFATCAWARSLFMIHLESDRRAARESARRGPQPGCRA